ncbi:MAG: hypothetical protein ACTTJ7_08745 [Treponema sp.]
MNFTDKLPIDLNDETFFPDAIMFQSKENPNRCLINDLEFLNKTQDEIITEVAARARKVFDFE